MALSLAPAGGADSAVQLQQQRRANTTAARLAHLSLSAAQGERALADDLLAQRDRSFEEYSALVEIRVTLESAAHALRRQSESLRSEVAQLTASVAAVRAQKLQSESAGDALAAEVRKRELARAALFGELASSETAAAAADARLRQIQAQRDDKVSRITALQEEVTASRARQRDAQHLAASLSEECERLAVALVPLQQRAAAMQAEVEAHTLAKNAAAARLESTRRDLANAAGVEAAARLRVSSLIRERLACEEATAALAPQLVSARGAAAAAEAEAEAAASERDLAVAGAAAAASASVASRATSRKRVADGDKEPEAPQDVCVATGGTAADTSTEAEPVSSGSGGDSKAASKKKVRRAPSADGDKISEGGGSVKLPELRRFVHPAQMLFAALGLGLKGGSKGGKAAKEEAAMTPAGGDGGEGEGDGGCACAIAAPTDDVDAIFGESLF